MEALCAGNECSLGAGSYVRGQGMEVGVEGSYNQKKNEEAGTLRMLLCDCYVSCSPSGQDPPVPGSE